jgi:hypothetical protein
MGVTLITWSCGHFVQQKSPKYRTEAQFLAAVCEDYWFLAESAADDLANVATENHVASAENCPKCQEPTSAAVWKLRALGDINILRTLHAGSKACYLQIGANYHHLDFSQRAKLANDKRCAAAHAQFWISKVPRALDPFLHPISNITQLCDEAEKALETSESHEDVKKSFVHINKARAEVGHTFKPLDDLLSGVHLMSEASNRHKDDARSHNCLLSRESMVGIPKALGWLARMGDWEMEAVGALRKALKGRREAG